MPIWGRDVTKLECANHACKCLRSNLEKLVEDKPYYKGKGGLTKNIITRITKGVRSAIKMRSSEVSNSGKEQAVKKLEHDIRNSVFHVYGDHSRCSDFCRRREDVLPQNDADDTITGTCDQDRDENKILVDSQQAMWQGVVDKDEFEEARNGYASVGALDPEIVKDVSFLLNRPGAQKSSVARKFYYKPRRILDGHTMQI